MNNYRADFSLLVQKTNGKPLVYLDTAATAQKPRAVIQALSDFYEHDNANIHRGAYALSDRAGARYEAARATVCRFIHAREASEIVFTRGATEALNLVANSWGNAFLKAGDEIALTQLEHHANIVPWQFLRDRLGVKLNVIPITPEGEIRLEDVQKALTPRTKLLAVAHVSNALGTVLPIQEMTRLAHANGTLTLVDGAQAISHASVDVQALDADFYVFSGHKLYGPMGIGVLYGKREILEQMPPWQGGGGMIASVTFGETTFREPPARFEAGTPSVAEAIGLAAAIDYVSAIGMNEIGAHEAALLEETTERLRGIPGLRLIGTARRKAGLVSFVMENAHPHDIATVLDHEGIAIRAGHHCAQPVHQALGIPASARVSFGLYTSREDIDALERAVRKVREIFG